MTRHDKTTQANTRQDNKRQAKTRQGRTGLDNTSHQIKTWVKIQKRKRREGKIPLFCRRCRLLLAQRRFVIYIIYITTHVHFQWSISQDLVFKEGKCSSCALVAHMRHITKGMSRFVGSCLVLSCLLLSYLVLFVRDH